MKVAWGITGSGDKISDTIDEMIKIQETFGDKLKIEVFLSKAGAKVIKYYRLGEKLEVFHKVREEIDSNTPFLAGRLQMGEFKFFLIAPATSNTVAKISVGIADTLISNAVLQAVKGFIPVYIMPVDYYEGTVTTILPNGKPLKLRVRREDADNVRRLEAMDGIHPFEKISHIINIFNEYMANNTA